MPTSPTADEPAAAEGDEPIDPVALRRGLDTLCQVARRHLGEPGEFTMQERADRVRETFRETPDFELVERFFEHHVPSGLPTRQFERIQQGAAALGVDEFTCPALEQLLLRTWFATRRNYDGRELSGRETIDLFCEVARSEAVASIDDLADRRRAWGRASRERLTGIRGNLFLDALGRIPADARYERVLSFAREHGVEEPWSCDELATILALPGRVETGVAADP